MHWEVQTTQVAVVRSRLATIGALVLLLAGAIPLLGSSGALAKAPSVAKLPKLADNANLSVAVGNVTSWIFDSVSTTGFGANGLRSYWVNLSTALPFAGQHVELQTEPQVNWEGPRQFPFGADNLPPVHDWSWWVTTSNGSNDTANWYADPDGIHLDRSTPWANAGFDIRGVVAPQVLVQVDPTKPDGLSATGTGFVVNAPGYVNALPPDPTYANLTGSIHPALVRLSLGVGGQITGWNSTSGRATFNFAGLDAEFNVVEATGANVLLSLPAGTFGDGNSLPIGTPLNLSVQVDLKASSGYFPTPAAYYAIVSEIANHTFSDGEPVAYWSIGNEVVLSSDPEVAAFSTVINAAIAALAPHYPDARVGTDDMMDPTYLPEFENLTPDVGFLSMHRYPSEGLCITPNGSYCPPVGGGQGSPTPDLFSRPAFQSGTSGHLLPQVAARDWFNATGRWLPVLVTETNLGYVGGPGAPNQSLGTDPRTQTLIGAAWLGSFLIASSADNVSAMTFFAFTSGANLTGTVTYPVGGLGFGLTNQSANGTITRYAPYWAMRLWGTYLPTGSAAVPVNVSDNQSVDAWAVRSGTNVDVAVVNQVAANTTVHLEVEGNYSTNSTSLLDATTYREVYDPNSNSTSVERSGVRFSPNPTDRNLTIHGYGMAVLVFSPKNNSTGGAGNGSSGYGGGSYRGSGNGSGNGTGTNRSGSSNNNSGNQSSGGSTPSGSNDSGAGPNGSGANRTNGSAGGTTGGPSGSPPLGAAPPSGASAVGAAVARIPRPAGSTALGMITLIGMFGAGAGAYAAARSARRPPPS
jgi:hypothetical protein